MRNPHTRPNIISAPLSNAGAGLTDSCDAHLLRSRRSPTWFFVIEPSNRWALHSYEVRTRGTLPRSAALSDIIPL